LTAHWLSEVFDTELPRAYAAPSQQDRLADMTVSFGVGENADKRIDDEFECQVLAKLLRYGRPVLVDRGAGGEEAARVEALAAKLGSPSHLHLHDGSYAAFASHILQANLHVGYDSAGQHVAAAGNVPQISVFSGYAGDRMLARWRPHSPAARVIAVQEKDPSVLAETVQAISAVAAAERWAEQTD
jgi:ADP-heptose:LPS heptosyltransferase